MSDNKDTDLFGGILENGTGGGAGRKSDPQQSLFEFGQSQRKEEENPEPEPVVPAPKSGGEWKDESALSNITRQNKADGEQKDFKPDPPAPEPAQKAPSASSRQEVPSPTEKAPILLSRKPAPTQADSPKKPSPAPERSAAQKPAQKATKPVSPALQPQPKPQTRRISAEGRTRGSVLLDARARAGLSLEQVAQSTRIKKSFIESLERDDYSNLPPTVYVKAYVKSLCEIYKIDLEALPPMPSDLEESQELPEEIINEVGQKREINLESETRFRKIVLLSTIGILAAAGICTGAYFIFGHDKSGGLTAPVNHAKNISLLTPTYQNTAKDLEVFVTPQQFNMTSLKVPEK